MSEDLENTLSELGPEYVSVVARLKSSGEVEPIGRAMDVFRKRKSRHLVYAIAAALAVATCLGWIVGNICAVEYSDKDFVRSSNPYSLAFEKLDEKVLTEIKRTQNPDGSWINDHLTRQNAAVLKKIDVSSVAYKRALRYLRSRGLEPFTDAEFHSYKTASVSFKRRYL